MPELGGYSSKKEGRHYAAQVPHMRLKGLDEGTLEAQLVVAGLREVQRCSKVGVGGLDRIGVVLVACQNDRLTLVTALKPDGSIPPKTDDFAHARFIDRLVQLYATRFAVLYSRLAWRGGTAPPRFST